mgnify:CR=1 FL=1
MNDNIDEMREEVDRKIAEALGYYVDNNHALAPMYWLVDEDGLPVDDNFYAGSESAWESAPWYHTDANAVIAVCAERDLCFESGRQRFGEQLYWWTIVDMTHGILNTERYTAHGATPQEAAARALLAALTSEVA